MWRINYVANKLQTPTKMLKWVLFRRRFEMNASRVTFTRVLPRFICRIIFDLATHNIVSCELGTRRLGKILVWNKIDTVFTKGNQRGGRSSHIHMYSGKNKGIDLVPCFPPGLGA
jgi:hypothetical protein